MSPIFAVDFAYGAVYLAEVEMVGGCVGKLFGGEERDNGFAGSPGGDPDVPLKEQGAHGVVTVAGVDEISGGAGDVAVGGVFDECLITAFC